MTRGNDKNNHLKEITLQMFFVKVGPGFPFFYILKRKRAVEYVNLYSIYYTEPLPSQVLDVVPGLISNFWSQSSPWGA